MRRNIVGDAGHHFRLCWAGPRVDGVWRPSDAGPLFAFLTWKANEIVRAIRSKAMLVMMHKKDCDVWLRTDGQRAEVGSALPIALGDGRLP